MRNLISCAACKVILKHETLPTQEVIVADNCHFGRNTHGILDALQYAGYVISYPQDEDMGQGFLDESGNFLTRKEAYKVAVTSGQPFNPEYVLGDASLDSSCIRHFPKHESLSKYLKK